MSQHSSRLRSVEAVWARQKAAEARVFAGKVARLPKQELLQRADQLSEHADDVLSISSDEGTALPAAGDTEIRADDMKSGAFVDTLRTSPDMVAVDASRQRLGLADQAGNLALALDAAATVKAENSVEKMLAHQIAAAHTAAMTLQSKAFSFLQEYDATGRRYTQLSVEAGRLMNASARMMAAAQQGALALNRLRTAGRQTLVVQHVHISQGGQAVVAGEVSARGRRPNR